MHLTAHYPLNGVYRSGGGGAPVGSSLSLHPVRLWPVTVKEKGSTSSTTAGNRQRYGNYVERSAHRNSATVLARLFTFGNRFVYSGLLRCWYKLVQHFPMWWACKWVLEWLNIPPTGTARSPNTLHSIHSYEFSWVNGGVSSEGCKKIVPFHFFFYRHPLAPLRCNK